MFRGDAFSFGDGVGQLGFEHGAVVFADAHVLGAGVSSVLCRMTIFLVSGVSDQYPSRASKIASGGRRDVTLYGPVPMGVELIFMSSVPTRLVTLKGSEQR